MELAIAVEFLQGKPEFKRGATNDGRVANRQRRPSVRPLKVVMRWRRFSLVTECVSTWIAPHEYPDGCGRFANRRVSPDRKGNSMRKFILAIRRHPAVKAPRAEVCLRRKLVAATKGASPERARSGPWCRAGAAGSDAPEKTEVKIGLPAHGLRCRW
jgi:hypothetical protein